MSEEPDDWFERALENDEPDAADDADPVECSRGGAESEPDDVDGDQAGETDADTSTTGDGRLETVTDWNTGETDATTDVDDERSPSSPPERDDDDGSLFEEDFGSALSNVEDPSVGTATDAETDGVEFGFSQANDTDFEADADSELPRLEIGIEGLDGMIQGGVPERSLMVTIGSAGTGKTTFGLQFLDHGLAQGENAVFIALEESRERVITSATEKGYPFDEYVAEDRLAIVDLDPVEMATSLTSIQSELPTLVEEFDASRLVLDSVSLLEMMYDEQATRRNEVYDFTKSLKEAGVTALLTSEASQKTAYASRHGIIEYLTDAVFVLQYVRPDDFHETRLAVEIQKIRDANHSREKKPYEITDDGISVHQQANLF